MNYRLAIAGLSILAISLTFAVTSCAIGRLELAGVGFSTSILGATLFSIALASPRGSVEAIKRFAIALQDFATKILEDLDMYRPYVCAYLQSDRVVITFSRKLVEPGVPVGVGVHKQEPYLAIAVERPRAIEVVGFESPEALEESLKSLLVDVLSVVRDLKVELSDDRISVELRYVDTDFSAFTKKPLDGLMLLTLAALTHTIDRPVCVEELSYSDASMKLRVVVL